jgi:hypothetical protein
VTVEGSINDYAWLILPVGGAGVALKHRVDVRLDSRRRLQSDVFRWPL